MTIRHIPAVATPYAHIINTANSQWWNTDTAAFEAFDAGNLADYAVLSGTQFGTTGIWPWTFPSGIAAGQYTVFVYDGDDDSLVEAGVVDWDGSALNVAADVRKVTGTAVADIGDFNDLGTNAPANWINAAAIAASALNGKGDWNVGKTGYALASNGLASVTAWTVDVTGNITGNLSGSVGSVTTAVETDSASRTASKATAGEIRSAVGLGSANLDTQLGDIDAAADVAAGILATLTEDVSGLRFTEKALEEAPTGSGGGGDDAATIYSYFADGSRSDIFKADVSGLAEKTDLPTNFAAMEINASGHVSRVVLVDTTTANTDMRGTDSAYTGTPPTQAEIYTYFADGTRPNIFKADVSGLVETGDLPANFSALGINGSGHVSRVTLVDTTTENTDMRGTDSANTVAPLDADGTRTALGLPAADLGDRLDDLPTVAEFNARSLPSDDYFVVGDYTEPPTAEEIRADLLKTGVTYRHTNVSTTDTVDVAITEAP